MRGLRRWFIGTGSRNRATNVPLVTRVHDMTHCPACGELLDDDAYCGTCHSFFAEGLICRLSDPDPDPGVRGLAADNLTFVQCSCETVTALANALDDADSDVRLSAGVTLFGAKSAARHVIRQLIEALDHSDIRVRRVAAACLPNVGPEAENALPRLRQIKDDQDDRLRAWVEHAISRIEAVG